MKTLIGLFIISAVIFAGISTAGAQTPKSEKLAAKTMEVRKMINDVSYVFKANYMIPQRGGSKALNYDYDLVVSKDTINAFLPYYGQAYVSPTDPSEGGIKFKSTDFEYKAKENKKGGWDVFIKPKERNRNSMLDVQSMRISINATGYASLSVLSSNRDPISFEGYIEARR